LKSEFTDLLLVGYYM